MKVRSANGARKSKSGDVQGLCFGPCEPVFYILKRGGAATGKLFTLTGLTRDSVPRRPSSQGPRQLLQIL